jgi:hypothetical protein
MNYYGNEGIILMVDKFFGSLGRSAAFVIAIHT